ncbi:hypothetical protein DC365_22060 [Vibrio vulnificus]|uniref:hypothetical protein n=1 Tax=Vibrio vulnificus TaxID=672 RepID=UPI000D3E099B|nr:hypothetical protein [Vibrio vulnificus]PUZ92981.1 hypothetical protein DC365_22060 [Vibrio vulnificus]HAS6031719.1 hypothetical protein [Vibrio vulnificus]HAS6116855.1 hypothetical protein [Vibrio vulnificus]HAS6126275.1 hypothetical protein [Vibrio vulnificus]HAS6130962.1 hypothetical protein [Vibrio vulnificus]
MMNNPITKGTHESKHNEPRYKPAWAIIVFTVLSILLFFMLKKDLISELSFVTLTFVVIITSFGILVLDFIKELDLKGFKLTLREMKDTETNVKHLAEAILELSKASESKFSEWVTEDTPKINERYYSAIKTLEKLISDK